MNVGRVHDRSLVPGFGTQDLSCFDDHTSVSHYRKRCDYVKEFVLEIASVFEGDKHGNGYHDYDTPCC